MKGRLLSESRKDGKLGVNDPGKLKVFIYSTTYEPTSSVFTASDTLQKDISTGRIIHHMNPDSELFYQAGGLRIM